MTRARAVRRRARVRLVALAVAVAAAVALLPACSSGPGGGPVVTADFARGTGLYPGSPVRVLGIDVGRVTGVTNVDGHVRVRMELSPGTEVPAEAFATIVPFTLLGERYVQLGPAYRSGARLGDGDHIPLARTSVPAEIDDLLRSLQDFMGAIDPKRAGDVVTNLAQVLDGRGAQVNDLIHDAAGVLDVLADKGDDLQAIIGSLRDLSATLRGRTDSIDRLISNYDLVSQVLVDNKDDLDAVITELDRAAVELTGLVAAHQDPLRDDVRVLADTSGTLAANTDNLQLTLGATVKLFEAAGRAYEARTNALRVNNQLSPELTSDLLAGRLRDRVAGLCRRLGIDACANPASPLLNRLAGLLPGLLAGGDQLAAGPPAPPSPPTTVPEVPTTVPAVPTPKAPDPTELVALLAGQLTDGLDGDQQQLLGTLDAPRLVALLGLDPTLLAILPELDDDQVARLRDADPQDLEQVMTDLFNEVRPPSSRLDVPLLPPRGTTPTTLVPLPGGGGVTVPALPGLGG